MPGPLAKAHAKYDQACEKCHDPFKKIDQRQLCLDCHKKVSADISAGAGFHGRSQRVREVECRHCHNEHKGVDAEIVLLDRDVFSHKETDFELRFSHQSLKCEKCHKPNIKFRDTPNRCIECHRKKEPHRGLLGEDCNKCHRETKWQDYSFDHATTKFALSGAHKGKPCIACHADQRWKLASRECIDCHRVNDVHGGSFGKDCGKCHSAAVAPAPAMAAGNDSKWRQTSFDHQKSRFRLEGSHRKVPCLKCHAKEELHPGSIGKEQPITCVGCHRNDDFHKSRFGEKCENCHKPAKWQEVRNDHNKTKFPLKFKHETVPCIKCHTGSITVQKLPLECSGCHALDDRHQGAFGPDCGKCHTPEAWKKASFDHRKTKFKLEAKHQQVVCVKCHPAGQTKESLKSECHSCHAGNDPHKGKLGTTCQKCHNTKGWRNEVFFDHDLTDFPLIGLHAITPCESCHQSTSFKDTSPDCYGCHAGKDQHQKRLGVKCFLCHNPNGWKLWSFDHDQQSKFPLTGAHVGLDCLACHLFPLENNKKPPTECASCHARHDHHRGKFGIYCQRCHITESFKKITIGK